MEINQQHFDVQQFSSDKILKHLDRVKQWLKGKNPYPITVELDMTNHCNQRCPECTGAYSQHLSQDSLPKDLAKSIIRQLARVKIRGLIFTGGGEPLCHPYTLEIVKLAKRLGMDIGFITNGSLINKEAAEVLLKSCRWVRVSLDAASAKMFKKVHGLNSEEFQKVISNIGLLVKLKKKFMSQTTIGIGYLTSNFTKTQMQPAAKLGKKLEVDYLQFRPMQLPNKKLRYHCLDLSKEISKCLKESTDSYQVLYSKHKYDMMEEKNFGRNYEKCFGQQFATVIGADAKMYLCCHLRRFAKYCLGNLKKNSFKEIWNSSQRKKVIEKIDFKDCIPLCRDNTFNQILWNIKQPREHVNFL